MQLNKPRPALKLTHLPDDILRSLFKTLSQLAPFPDGTSRPLHLPAMLPLAATCHKLHHIFQTSLSTLEIHETRHGMFDERADKEISLFIRQVGSFVTKLRLGPLRWMDRMTIRAIGSHCLQLRQLDLSLLECVDPMELEAMFMLVGAGLHSLRLSSCADGRCSSGELSGRVLDAVREHCRNVRRLALDHLHIGSRRGVVRILNELGPQLQMLVIARLPAGVMGREVWDGIEGCRNISFLHVVTSEGMGPLYFGRVLRRLIKFGELRGVRMDGPDLMHGEILGCILKNVHGMVELIHEAGSGDCVLADEDRRRVSLCGVKGFTNAHAKIVGNSICELRELEVSDLGGLGDVGFLDLIRHHEETLESIRVTRCSVRDRGIGLIGMMRFVREVRLIGLGEVTDCGISAIVCGRKGRLERFEMRGLPEVTGWSLENVWEWGSGLEEGRLEHKYSRIITEGLRGNGRIEKAIQYVDEVERYEYGEDEELSGMLRRVEDIDVEDWSSEEDTSTERSMDVDG